MLLVLPRLVLNQDSKLVRLTENMYADQKKKKKKRCMRVNLSRRFASAAVHVRYRLIEFFFLSIFGDKDVH